MGFELALGDLGGGWKKQGFTLDWVLSGVIL